MNDPRGATDNALDASGDSDARTRNTMAEALQKALRSFGGQDALSSETLTPEVLTQIAHRAGITSSAQISELARMMGMSIGGSGDSAGMSVPQHIIFALNDSECTFPAGSVQAIERVGDISTVPNTVSWVLGIIHLHGSILSVVDLRGFFGLPVQPITQRSRLLIITKREMSVGLLVDGVNEMRQLSMDQSASQSASAPGWAAPYAMGTINIEGRPVIMLDPERLLFADKMHRYHA